MTLALGECSDGELAALALAGRQAAFRELLDRHRASVFRLARGSTGDDDAALDVTQEAFIAAFAALKSYDLNQELVARSLGASRPRAFFTITLPQIRFALMTSALLAFLTSFDEVIMAQFIAGGDNSTLTRKMFSALRDQIDPTIAAISTLMIGVTTVLLGLTQLLGRAKK